MIVHEAKPHQPHGHFFVCLSHQFDESEEVIRLVKNIIATVTAIKNVVNKTALRCSGCAWHSITITTLATQLKYNVPFLRSPFCVPECSPERSGRVGLRERCARAALGWRDGLPTTTALELGGGSSRVDPHVSPRGASRAGRSQANAARQTPRQQKAAEQTKTKITRPSKPKQSTVLRDAYKVIDAATPPVGRNRSWSKSYCELCFGNHHLIPFPRGISFDTIHRKFVRTASWHHCSIAESGDENFFHRETIPGHLNEMVVMSKKHDLSAT